MNRSIPKATLAVIDGAGHLPNLEQPTAFNDVLRDFLTGIESGGAGEGHLPNAKP